MRTLVCAIALAALAFTGCNNDFSRGRGASGDDLVLRAHFIGSEQLLKDKNAPKLVEVWNLKSSAKLRGDALTRFSRLPAAWMGNAVPKGSSDHADQFRALLEDALANESFVEWRNSSFVLAAKLPETRAKVWDANLKQVATGWKLGSPAAFGTGDNNGWTIAKAGAPAMRFARSGDWVAVSVGQGAAAAESNALARVKQRKASGAWLEGNANLAQWKGRAPLLEHFSNLPTAHFSFSNRADFVRTLVQFDFPKPHQWKSEPWLVPTNFIWDPLADFTVVRGIGGVLDQVPFIHNLGLKPAPTQICGWGNRDLPFQHYYTVPSRDVVNQLKQIEPRLRKELRNTLGTNVAGELIATTNSLFWRGLPTAPVIGGMKDGNSEFIFFQLSPLMRAKDRPPRELYAQIANQDDLVYYDWESTQYRLPSIRQFYQIGEMVTRRPLAPVSAPDIAWQLEIAPHLADSITELRSTTPSQMRLMRKSSIGFTAVELVTISRWLESTNFPAFGVYATSSGASLINRWPGKPAK